MRCRVRRTARRRPTPSQTVSLLVEPYSSKERIGNRFAGRYSTRAASAKAAVRWSPAASVLRQPGRAADTFGDLPRTQFHPFVHQPAGRTRDPRRVELDHIHRRHGLNIALRRHGLYSTSATRPVMHDGKLDQIRNLKRRRYRSAPPFVIRARRVQPRFTPRRA